LSAVGGGVNGADGSRTCVAPSRWVGTVGVAKIAGVLAVVGVERTFGRRGEELEMASGRE
jgi:hypothetical protein